MTETAKLVSRSLRLIQVLDADEAAESRDMETAIDALNAMVRRWEANGLSLGWQPVSNPADEFPVPPEAEEAVVYNLAVRVAPEYGTEAMPSVVSGAREFLSDLLRDQAVATPIQPILDAPWPDYWNSRTLNGSSWYIG
jgi:hypothetical protein